MTTGGYFVFDPDFEPITWTAEERARGQFWGVQTVESFHTYGHHRSNDVAFRDPAVRRRRGAGGAVARARPPDRHLLAEARPDLSVEVGARLRVMGHEVTVHFCSRMVRDRAHLDDLLARMADAGIDDAFVVGGDATQPLGEYSSAVQLLP